MTTEQTNVIVFKDQAGEFYLLPQATLEQSRVPAEHKAEVEQLIAEQEDVQGHLLPALVAVIALAGGTSIVGGGVLIWQEATKTGTLKGLKPQ